jgi:hypothetical protein
MKLFNPIVFFTRIGRNVAMQRIADAVSDGYTQYHFGSILVSKLVRLVKKFDIQYQIGLTCNQRLHRRRNGMGNAKLILWQSSVDTVDFYLLVSNPEAGYHPAHALEDLLDCNEIPIRFGDYELVKSNLNGANNTKNKQYKLTWRFAKAPLEEWKSGIKHHVRNCPDFEVNQLLLRLFKSPGFAGIRQQVGHLCSLYRAEIKRANRPNPPMLPKKLGYCRRLSDAGLSMLTLISRYEKRLGEE